MRFKYNKGKNQMKKLFIAFMIVLTVSAYSMAAEKKPLKDVATDAFTADTQTTLQGTGDNHVALAWWIPNEFWKSIFSRDTTTSESDKKAMLDAMSGISLLAVVQADITAFGAFQYYSKDEIERSMSISFTNADGKRLRLSPMQTINPDLEVVLNVFKPILAAAMGNLGNNMHFYVLNDKSKSSHRLLDPYRKGQINIKLLRKDEVLMTASIEMPLDSLFVPRKCPNGKDAHISWKYCPWSGERLAN